MLCKIADLYVEVPAAGGLAPRCREYLWNGEPDGEVFIIREERYDREFWTGCSEEFIAYLESGHQFSVNLLQHCGLRLHASALVWKERAYLFSGPSGMGKSTHNCQWQQLYGKEAVITINDDKPALRYIDDRWYAYGTPWCGKDGINRNMKAPLAGICFLERGTENRIRKLTPIEAIPRILDQTFWRLDTQEEMILLMDNLDRLVQKIPVFLLECTPTTDAAKLSSETMSKAADEAGL